jgi:hypothetical protein
MTARAPFLGSTISLALGVTDVLAAGAGALGGRDVLAGASGARRCFVSGVEHDVSRFLGWRVSIFGSHLCDLF